MNYEQKYNEVLQKAKEEYNRLGELGNESMKRRFEIIFPELRESEDERIRKTLLDEMMFLKEKGQAQLLGLDINDIIAYLEKQKEQKPVEWSEEDERNIASIEGIINGSFEDFDLVREDYPINAHSLKSWLKSLRPQQKVEWRWEDESICQDIIYVLQSVKQDSWRNQMCNWLNSLRPSWKPSEEQLVEGLEEAATEFANQDCVTFISRKKGFIAGAEWQRKQDQSLIELAEDHAMLAGMNKMKEEMMEKAVDGRVIKSYNPVTAIGQPTLHGIELIYPDMDKPYIIAGDTVKVIFIPEKSEKVK